MRPLVETVRYWALALLFAAGVVTGGTDVVAAAEPSDYFLTGRTAPDFALRANAGGNVRLSEHRGEVVVLSFWGRRCRSCEDQLQALDRSFATYGAAGLQVFGVNIDDDPEAAKEAAAAHAVRFRTLLDPQKRVSRSYRVDNLPMTVLIDRSGTVRQVYRNFSEAGDAQYLTQLRALLNE